MRHNRKVKKLGRKKAHRIATIRNLLRSFFTHGKIRTTINKAKILRDHANRLVSRAQRDSLATKRYLFRYLNDHRLVKKLCVEIAPALEGYTGGFVRLFRVGRRGGDGAEMVIVSLVESKVEEKGKKKEKRKKEKKKKEKAKPKEKEKKVKKVKDKEKKEKDKKKEDKEKKDKGRTKTGKGKRK